MENETESVFDSVKDSLAALRAGEIVILADEKDRENEGDFVLAASLATPEKINFMLKFGRGIMCVPITREKAEKLSLQRMAANTDRFQTPFTVSVDAKDASTGVSVDDRLKAIKLLSEDSSLPSDFVRPGHMFPLVSAPFGVLERRGHTEGAVDLVHLAGLPQAAVIVEIMNDDGSMARLPDLLKLKEKFGLKILSIRQLVDFRLLNENLLEKVASPNVPTDFGEFNVFGFSDKVFGKEFIAVVKGSVEGKENVLTRVHSACFTGEILFSQKCDCRQQVSQSLELIAAQGGVLVYSLEHEGRGIGLLNKLRAYELQEKGLDTVEANNALGFEADKRSYAMPAQVLKALGVKSVRLISNNPEKIAGLERFGVSVSEVVPLKPDENPHNKGYLLAKKLKMAHRL